MLRLLLLRHAKSSWSDPRLEDHERPLAKRGAKAAPMIGRYLEQHSLVPDVVLCSTAVRTRATLTLVLTALRSAPPQVTFEDAIYLAQPEALQNLIHEMHDQARTVMVVGHNPGLHSLALSLTGRGDRKLIGALAQEFPTAALAAMSFKTSTWREIGPALGTLEHFVTPRRIEDA